MKVLNRNTIHNPPSRRHFLKTSIGAAGAVFA
ncbi:MAG: twin-arginine translocation signal domain-containing protein, partial [Luteolibacter sp.]